MEVGALYGEKGMERVLKREILMADSAQKTMTFESFFMSFDDDREIPNTRTWVAV